MRIVIENFITNLHQEFKELLTEIYTEAGVNENLASKLAEEKAETFIDRLLNKVGGGRMNISQLRTEIGNDEGRIEKIYNDHLGYPTFGIGHLVLKTDPEYGDPVDTPVSAVRVDEAFNADVTTVLEDCETLYPDFYDKPEEVKLIVANMMFNMGLTRLTKFRNMKKAVDEEDWDRAADEMMDSAWYRQVTNRAKRLVNRMRNV